MNKKINDEQLLLRLGTLKNFKNYNFKEYRSIEEYYIAVNLHNTLFKIDNNNNIVSGMAKSWKVVNGGKEYRIKIYDDLYWSNGDKIKIEEIVANIFLNNENLKSNRFDEIISIKDGRKNIAVNDGVIVIKLKKSYPNLLYYLTQSNFGLVDWKNKNNLSEKKYSGPYEISDFSEEEITLKKNINFKHNDNRIPDFIQVKYYGSKDLYVSDIAEGKIDFFEKRVELPNTIDLEEHYNIMIGSYDLLKTIQSRNVTEEQVRALKILNRYLNRDKIVKNGEVPARTLKLVSRLKNYQGLSPISKSDAIKELRSKKISINVVLDQKIIENKKVFNLIKGQAKEIGISLLEVYSESVKEEFYANNIESSILYMGTYSIDEISLWQGYFCSGLKPYKILHDEGCEYLIQAKNSKNDEEIDDNLELFYNKVLETGKIIPLYFEPRKYFVSKKWGVENYNNNVPYPYFTSFRVSSLQ